MPAQRRRTETGTRKTAMINSIIKFSLNNRIVILIAYLLLVMYGLASIRSMSVDVFPDLNRPQVALIIEAGGMSPVELEQQVIIPLENVINGATSVSRVFSNSNIGYGIVKVEFDWNTDIYVARQIVTEKIAQVVSGLPTNVKIAMGPVSSIMGEILMTGLSSPDGTVNQMELRDLADWNIKKRLQAVPGVSQVSVIGGDVKEYQVIADTNKLRLNGIALDVVRQALTAAGNNTNGGFIFNGYTEKLVRNIGRANTVEDIANSVLPINTGISAPALTIGDIAKVEIAPMINKRGDASINAVNGVILSIAKQPNVDTIDLTNRLENELKNIESTLPEGVTLTANLFRQANFIENSVENIKSAMIEGAILITIILFLFLLNFRTTLITLIVIPVSLIMTAIVFKAFGLSINTMTLGGLAMAMGSLVDDAIVAVANIFKKLKENKQNEIRQKNATVVYEAVKEVVNPIFFSTALLFLVFIPLFALSGIEGKIFTPLALAFILSIGASMVIAITLTPVMGYYLMPTLKVLDKKDSHIVRGLKAFHHWCLSLCFKFKKAMLLTVTALFGLSIIAIINMGSEFLPAFNEGSFNVSISMAPSTTLEEASRIRNIAQKQIMEIEEVEVVSGRSGRSDVDEHALGVNTTELEVALKKDIRRTTQEVAEDIRSRLELPGVFVNVGQPISHRIDFIISGIRSQVAVKLFGHDLDKLQSLAGEIEKIMDNIEGITDLSIEQQIKIPEVHVNIDRDKTRQYGVMAGDISRDIETGLAGEKIADIIEDDRFYDLVLRIDDKHKNSLKDIGRIPVETISGSIVPLKAIAEIKDSKGPNQISRENGKRRIVVQANIKGRDLVSVVNDIKKGLNKNLQLPEGYFVSFDGQFETQAKATRDIMILGTLSMVLIFAGLYMNFHSVNLALQLFTIVPLSLMGAITGVMFTSQVISLATIVGFITLTGIAIRNGILLLELYEAQNRRLSAKEIISLTGDRLTPVMMTTITSILGFVPLIIAGNTAGKEILYPAAVVITTGLISSTILNLIVTPVVYYMFGNKK